MSMRKVEVSCLSNRWAAVCLRTTLNEESASRLACLESMHPHRLNCWYTGGSLGPPCHHHQLVRLNNEPQVNPST